MFLAILLLWYSNRGVFVGVHHIVLTVVIPASSNEPEGELANHGGNRRRLRFSGTSRYISDCLMIYIYIHIIYIYVCFPFFRVSSVRWNGDDPLSWPHPTALTVALALWGTGPSMEWNPHYFGTVTGSLPLRTATENREVPKGSTPVPSWQLAVCRPTAR